MKKLIVASMIVIMMVSLFTVYGDSQADTVQELLKKANTLLYHSIQEEEITEEALALLDKVIELDPECTEAYDNKAYALFGLKRYSEAITYYDRLIAGSGFYYNLDYGLKKGAALMELKKYSEASKWFNEMKKHVVPYEYEQYAKVHYSNAGAYSMLKKTAQALAELELAIKYDKSYKAKAKTEKYLKNVQGSKRFLQIITFEENLLKRLSLGEGFYLIDHLTYDINGDKTADDIALVGHEVFNEEVNVNQLILVVIDNKSGKLYRITPKYTEGQIYMNRKHYLLSGDLNKDGVKDVTIQIGNKFSSPGLIQCGYSFIKNKETLIFSK